MLNQTVLVKICTPHPLTLCPFQLQTAGGYPKRLLHLLITVIIKVACLVFIRQLSLGRSFQFCTLAHAVLETLLITVGLSESPVVFRKRVSKASYRSVIWLKIFSSSRDPLFHPQLSNNLSDL